MASKFSEELRKIQLEWAYSNINDEAIQIIKNLMINAAKQGRDWFEIENNNPIKISTPIMNYFNEVDGVNINSSVTYSDKTLYRFEIINK